MQLMNLLSIWPRGVKAIPRNRRLRIYTIPPLQLYSHFSAWSIENQVRLAENFHVIKTYRCKARAET